MEWIDANKQQPELKEIDWGGASDYVLCYLSDGNIVNGRLEAHESSSNINWFSPVFDDSIDDVLFWQPLPQPPNNHL